jgi:hypothetical protein
LTSSGEEVGLVAAVGAPHLRVVEDFEITDERR